MALARDYKSYSKLVEFYNCFQNDYSISDLVSKVLQKEGDINYQFPVDSRITSRDPNLAGATALHIAAMKNNVEIFETLLNIGADITIQNHYGRTALHSVFLDQNIDDKKMFIDIALSTQLSFADPSNPCDFDGISHFHIACINNKVALVEFFLNSGIPIDSSVNVDAKRYAGYTPLHFAAEGCAIEVIKLLLKCDANMSAKDARGLTAFHVLLEEKITLMDTFSSMENQVSNSQVVAIDNALNQLMDSNDVDELGLTHFHIACAMQDTSVAEYYLDGQLVDIDQQVKMNSPFRPGYTALHFAVHCNLNIAKMLIRKKANFEVRSASGLTQMDLFWQKDKLEDLHTILNHSWKYTMFSDNKTRLLDFVNCLRVDNSVDMLEKYLRGLTDPTTHIKDLPTHWMNRTLLHFAVLICRDKHAIETCLIYGLGKNIDTPDMNGATPVHLAFRVNKLDIVEMLMKNRPNNLIDNDGLSYLHIACALGKLEYVEKLFPVSQDKNAKSVCRGHYVHPLVKPGSTALHVAMAGGHCAIIETLLYLGLSLRDTDNEGRTPLHNFLRLKNNIVDVCRVLRLSNEVSDWMLEEVGLTRLIMTIYCGEPKIDIYATPDAVKSTIKCDDPSSFLYDYNGCTPLHLAIKRGANTEILKTLLERGSDLLTLNHRGDCPLYAALSKSYDADLMCMILEILQSNRELRTQMVEMSGITMLHLACHVLDPVHVGWLLDWRGDTKARVKSDCPVWPGDTPIHVLIRAAVRGATDKQFCDTLAAIMQVNVDVTAMNEDGETPIHLALQSLTAIGMYNVLTILVQKLDWFTINPSSRHGWSHFHAACLVSNVSAVKSFLKKDVDVNQPIDFFATDLPGETPLHLAVEHKTEVGLGQYQAQYDIVGCLLVKGADAKAEDARGNTALHLAAATGKDPDIMQLLVENGAAIDSRNNYENTPLELLIKSNNISVERIQFFENYGCRLNVSNPLTKQSYLSMLIAQRNGACSIQIQTQCYRAVVGAMDGSTLDDMGRSLIHNIVTTNVPECQVFSHHNLIEKLKMAGVDVDLKDKTGKTALHLAAQFGNAYAVEELLQAGADINIVDSSNYTAVNYAVDYYFDEKLCPKNTCHSKVMKIFIYHLRTLETLRLHVNVNNIRAKGNALTNVLSNDRYFVLKEVTSNEIHRVMCTRIDNTELYLLDFLSDTGKGLVSYSFMSHERRESVDKFFSEYKYLLRDVCMLQYRKAVKRVELVKLAMDIVYAIAKTIVPMDCIEMIFQYLRNDELENFVEASSDSRVLTKL